MVHPVFLKALGLGCGYFDTTKVNLNENKEETETRVLYIQLSGHLEITTHIRSSSVL